MTVRADVFPITPLRLTLRSAGMRFPGFSGSLWHGGLGMMLKRHFPAAFDLLYGGDGETRLYALLPPPDSEQAADAAVDLRLTLIGPGTGHILACTQAIAQLGEHGLDPAGKYRLDAAAIIGPAGDQPFYSAADGLLAPPVVHDIHDYR